MVIYLRMNDELVKKLDGIAKTEKRSRVNLIAYFCEKQIEQREKDIQEICDRS